MHIWAVLMFIYSEKATKFYEIFPLLSSYVVPVKSKGKISQNFVVFSEYMNFTVACFLKVHNVGSPQEFFLPFVPKLICAMATVVF